MAYRLRLLSVSCRVAGRAGRVPAVAFGQRTTTGTIVGKIVDASGAVLPGVTVQLTSPEALGDFSGVTDGQRYVPRDEPAARDV